MSTPMRRFLVLIACLLFALPALAARPAPALVEGTDYVLVDNPQPYAPLADKIEVVEVFGYW
jgi:thiol:disulfide interchange protein DsbA